MCVCVCVCVCVLGLSALAQDLLAKKCRIIDGMFRLHDPTVIGPERGPGKGTMADLGPLIRHQVSTRLPSGGRAAFLSPLSPMHGTRPSV